MKKISHALVKIIKWYIIADIAVLAFMGWTKELEVMREYPELGVIDAAAEAFMRSVKSFKRHFRR